MSAILKFIRILSQHNSALATYTPRVCFAEVVIAMRSEENKASPLSVRLLIPIIFWSEARRIEVPKILNTKNLFWPILITIFGEEEDKKKISREAVK